MIQKYTQQRRSTIHPAGLKVVLRELRIGLRCTDHFSTVCTVAMPTVVPVEVSLTYQKSSYTVVKKYLHSKNT